MNANNVKTSITDERGYRLIPVYEDKTLMEPCAEILNEEWKRSTASRIAVLDKSKPELPLSLALLSPDGAVIGHSRLVPVLDRPTACIVLSVVVPKYLRGQGEGRRLMTLTEKFALSRGYDTMYLTTHDKQAFYERLGYEKSESVTSLGEMSHLAKDDRFKQFISSISSSAEVSTENSKSDVKKVSQDKPPESPSGIAPPPPPCAPPPPPPPKAPVANAVRSNDPESITWYKKLLK